MMSQFCYLRLFLGIETFSWCLFLWMARMDIQSTLANVNQNQVSSSLEGSSYQESTVDLSTFKAILAKIPQNI